MIIGSVDGPGSAASLSAIAGTSGDRHGNMPDDWLRDLCSWASGNECVRELWLFGSRATGRSRPDSVVDIAIALMPAIDRTDWALGNSFALHSDWKQQLETIVGHHVSFETIVPNTPEDEQVR